MEEYLMRLLEQIRCKKARPYIRQELQDHIEDQIEANLCAGMEREQAEREAIRDMGDPIEVGISLDRIHKPQIAWKLLAIMLIISVMGIWIHTMIVQQSPEHMSIASGRYVIHVMIGFAVMMVLYFLDYTMLARFSKVIAAMLLALCLLTLRFGSAVNGMIYWVVLGGNMISMRAVMLFYVPIYGGVIYKYRGTGYKGLMKVIAWMIAPVFLVLKIPGITTAGLMLISMLSMLTIAIQKNWFAVRKRKVIGAIWSIFLIMPMAVLLVKYLNNGLLPYQVARIQAYFNGNGEVSYLSSVMRNFWDASQMLGTSSVDLCETLPEFNTDYILTYLSSTYGMIAAIVICCVLVALLIAVFNTALKQKNQLGMIMGCGCGMILLGNFLINVLGNLGVIPPTMTFLPFLSAGGSYIVVAYGMMGIVLSIYRYKNVYPRHMKIDVRQNNDSIIG